MPRRGEAESSTEEERARTAMQRRQPSGLAPIKLIRPTLTISMDRSELSAVEEGAVRIRASRARQVFPSLSTTTSVAADRLRSREKGTSVWPDGC
ncbi:hypothetical protein GW17_00043534 [Ensete ventricosum]|nr:hypothetical protein GW17_00043534 [Ensete ventricosum]